jgi:hypothetical protein
MGEVTREKGIDKGRAGYAAAGCPGALDPDGWQSENGGQSRRCWHCMAVVGSVADPCRRKVREEAGKPATRHE